jgi:CheY-like chemotaxis protein
MAMYNILIVDFSSYKETIAKIFSDEGYLVEIAESAFEAMSKLKAFDFDLIVSEVELPGDNAFDLYNYLNKNYPYIPAIMTTDKDMEAFFDQIFQEGIGNVLLKPVKRGELLSLAEKLITKKNIFGLKNHIKDIDEIKRIRINASKQIQKAVDLILDNIAKWGFEIESKMILNLVLNEMIINAIYHSHGFTKEKEERKPIQLHDDLFVEIFFGKSKSAYGISINDYNGKLSKARILESINSAVRQNQLILEAYETGEDISDQVSETGRGIDLLRKLISEYYFIIKKDVRTEIILIFDTAVSGEKRDYSSLKIIEDLTPT